METSIIIAILVIAVLALVWRVIVLRRKNSEKWGELEELKNTYNELLKSHRELSIYSDKKYNEVMELIKVNNRLENQLNDLRGEYAKELKKLKSEKKVLLAKCTFLEACNEEAVKRKEPRYKKGEFVKEVGVVLSTTTHPVSYGQMRDTFKCSQSSLTCALSSLIKQGKVKRVKKGWYKWNKTNNDFPDFPVK